MRDNGIRISYDDIFRLSSAKTKEKEEYYIAQSMYIIGNLVRNKRHYQTAYNYYNGIFRPEDYTTFTNNYNVGTPCDVKFIPLMRKYIQFLLGVSQSRDVKFKVSFNSQSLIDRNVEEKKNKMLSELQKMFVEQFNNPHLNVFKETELNKLNEFIQNRFQTNLELTCADILNYVQRHLQIDFKGKFTLLEQDLYVYGECAYKVTYDKDIHNFPILEAVNPMNLFYLKNSNNIFLNSCDRIVYRYWDTPENIISNYGHQLKKDEIDTIYRYAGLGSTAAERDNYLYLKNTLDTQDFNYQESSNIRNMVECYHTEWLADNEIEVDSFDTNGKLIIGKKEKRYIQDRYSCRRIGNIFFDMKKDENVIRNVQEPYRTKLSYNGIALTDRNSIPYSLVLKTKDLQDKYNIYHFQRDVAIAHAGVKGVNLDMSMLPKFQGLNEEDRLYKFLGMLKQGVALYDTSDDAMEGKSSLNTLFNGFDMSLTQDVITAYNLAIQSVEEDASKITGIPLQALGQIEQRDAVSNVKAGISQSLIVNKVYFTLIDRLKQYCLTDIINLCSGVFKQGFKGAYVTEEGLMKTFTLKEDLDVQDLGVFIEESSEQFNQTNELKAFVLELVKAQQIDASVAIKLISCKSLSEANLIINKALESNSKQELMQLQEQLQELQKENEKLNKNANDLMMQELSLKQKEVLIQEQKVKNDNEFKNRELKENTDLQKQELEIKKQQVQAEVLQLYDENTKNNEILNV